MKKTKSGYITLYTIEGIDYDAIIVKYQQLCVEGDKKIDTSKQNLSVYGFVEPNYKETRKSRKPVDDTKTIRKIKYLVHTIAYRQITNPDENTDGVGIQAEILQGVIGKDYKVLLDALQELKYIKKFNNYIPGKLAKRYKVLGNIITTSIFDVKIEKYINDTNNAITITPTAAKNLPNTTPVILTGDVNINCSVPFFLSSANILIVNIGATIINP